MLTSAKADVLKKLAKGDVLRVNTSGGKLPLVAVDKKPRIAGTIVLPEQDQLVDCIKRGTKYTAKVVSLEGGSCIVHISAEGA
jgi:hypothetical protein